MTIHHTDVPLFVGDFNVAQGGTIQFPVGGGAGFF